jgi:hypothetical protein
MSDSDKVSESEELCQLEKQWKERRDTTYDGKRIWSFGNRTMEEILAAFQGANVLLGG